MVSVEGEVWGEGEDLPFPNKGGKERTKRIATAINHPRCRSRSFLVNGVNQSTICTHQPQHLPHSLHTTPFRLRDVIVVTGDKVHSGKGQKREEGGGGGGKGIAHTMMKERHERYQNDNHHESNVVPCPFFTYPESPVGSFRPSYNTLFILFSLFFSEFEKIIVGSRMASHGGCTVSIAQISG